MAMKGLKRLMGGRRVELGLSTRKFDEGGMNEAKTLNPPLLYFCYDLICSCINYNPV